MRLLAEVEREGKGGKGREREGKYYEDTIAQPLNTAQLADAVMLESADVRAVVEYMALLSRVGHFCDVEVNSCGFGKARFTEFRIRENAGWPN